MAEAERERGSGERASRAAGGRIAHLIATEEHHASSSASSDAGSVPIAVAAASATPPCDRIVPSRLAGPTADAEEKRDTGGPARTRRAPATTRGRRPGLGDKRTLDRKPGSSPGVLLDAFSRDARVPERDDAAAMRAFGDFGTRLTIFRRHSWRCEEKGPRHEPVWGVVPGAHTSARAALARRRRPRRGRAWVGEGARDVGCARGSRLRRHPRARPPRWFKLAPSRLGVWHPLLAGRAEPERVDGRGRGRRVGRGGDERRGRRGQSGGGWGADVSDDDGSGGGQARTSPSTSTTPARAGGGRRLGRRCPRGHRRLGLRPRDEQPDASGWVASDPRDARDANPTAFAATRAEPRTRKIAPTKRRWRPISSSPPASAPARLEAE